MLRQDRACLHHLLCIFTKLIKQNCTHLHAFICTHFFRFFWQEYAMYCNKQSGIKVCKEMLAGTSALIVLIPMYSKQRLAKTQNRRNYADFFVIKC